MLAQSLKAITAGLLAAAATLLAANGAFTDGGSNITDTEWWSVLGTFIAVGGGTWLVPNYNYPAKPPPGQ